MPESFVPPEVNRARRSWLNLITAGFAVVGAVFAAIPFIRSFQPSARARAIGAPVEIDIRDLQSGEMRTVSWRGKPVWVVHRDERALQSLDIVETELADPLSRASTQPQYVDAQNRALRKDILVLIGVCTHLGCAPTYRPNLHEISPDWQGGFHCACHGSRFDFAGRVFKNMPAPLNLTVPPYRFKDANTIVIGENSDPSQLA